jgi:hypothetical protein
MFLEWFTVTQMFEVFMTEELQGRKHGKVLLLAIVILLVVVAYTLGKLAIEMAVSWIYVMFSAF